MAQKKKVTPKSQAGSKAMKARPAATAKPARKTGETKSAPPARKPAKPPQKIVAKTTSKPAAAKPAPASKPAVGKPVAAKAPAPKPVAAKPIAQKPVAQKPTADKAAAKPDVKKAATPAPAATPKAAKPVAGAKPVAAPAKPAPTAHSALNGAARPAAQGAPKMPVPPVAANGNAGGGPRTFPTAMPKPAVRTFPVAPAAVGGTPRDLAHKALDARHQQVAAAAAAAAKKPVTNRHGFKINESIVYPAHGVGRIIAIEEQEIAGMPLELFVIQFEKDKMTLRVPTGKLQSVGMRKLAEDDIVTRAMDTLKGRARVKRTMWSRRAQEYEAKINSGDLISIAEVVRDLYRSENQPEQSYSERQLYEAALDRMAREIAAVARIDERGAVQRITEVLAKSAKGRRAAETPAEPAEDAGADAEAA